MKMQKITGFNSISVDGTRYEWNDTFGEYWSSTGEPRVLQNNDAAVLELNQVPLFVGDPTSVGFAYKSITDASFSGRTREEHRQYCSDLKNSLGVDSWFGTLAVKWGESLRETVLANECS